MAWDPFNDYRKNGYLQNIHRLPLGDDLKQLEHEDFAVFLEDALLHLSQCVSPSYDDLLEVHKILFEGLYPTWAGKDRNELTPHDNVRKGNTIFCEPHNLRKAFEIGMKAPTLGQQLGHWAYTHPFLDGNGRAIFTFATRLQPQKIRSLEYFLDQKDNLQPRSSIVLFENHIDWLHHPKTLPRFVFDGG